MVFSPDRYAEYACRRPRHEAWVVCPRKIEEVRSYVWRKQAAEQGLLVNLLAEFVVPSHAETIVLKHVNEGILTRERCQIDEVKLVFLRKP